MREALSPHRPAADDAGRRFTALRAAGLLDAPAEERFDRLTRLARQLLRVPVALVSLLDADRQFFLSAQGLPEPWAGLRQTPLAYSFCRSVVESGLPLAVADAREDPRVRGNPAVEELGVTAYAAVPLALPDGCVVGALCGIDREPRAWTAAEEGALRDLAGAVEAEMAAGLRLREAERAAAALRESEARYRALFEVSPQMVWFADAKGRCTYVNQHYADFVGLPAERALGDGWLPVVHPADRACAHAAWAGAVASEADYEVEYRIRRGSDGSHRWFLVRGAPLRGGDGRIERWIGVGVDIDERRRAEAALRGLIEALGVAVYTTDAAGRLTFYNEAAVALWGRRPPLGDARWCGSWRLHGPDGAPMPHEECPMAAVLRENRPIRGEEAVAERPDGVRVPFAAYPTPLRDDAGRLVGGVNVLVDISKRKAAEVALAESEARLHLALEAGRLAFWELDLGTGAVLRAAFHDAIFGYEAPLPEWSYEAFLGHVVPEDRGAVERAYRAAAEGGSDEVVECRIRRAGDGAVRWLEVHGRAQRDAGGRVVRLHGVLRDVTERKRAEEALRSGEERLRLIVEGARDYAIFTTDPRDRIVDWAPGAAAVFGWSVEEAVGRPGAMLFTPEDREAGLPEREVEAARREGVAPNVRWHLRKDGARVFIEGSVRALRGPGEGVRSFLKIGQDVTERRRAEEALRASEERFRRAVGIGTVGVLFFGLDGRMTDANAAFERMSGYSRGELVAIEDWEALTPPEFMEATARAAAELAERGETAPYEKEHIRKDGSRWWGLFAPTRLSGSGRGSQCVEFIVDITERKRAEEALRASEARLRELQAELLHVSRLSAAGEMAAALAHELNQPLTAAASAVQAARRMLASSPEGPGGQPPEVREAMDLAAEQALRGGQIVRRLRDFVARGEADPRLESLPRLAEEAAALALVGARERGVAVALRLDPGLPAVLADRIQVQQVLFNLMRNALEAMGDGEVPAGGGGGAPRRRRELVVSAAPAGPDTVEIAVADTGPGLAPEAAGRLFEPFVSTKPGGMGVGLSICRTIVEAHSGRIWAEPNPGGGTVFRFTLPTAPPLEAGARYPQARGLLEKGRR
jgi:two-component system sensor kinase FixL